MAYGYNFKKRNSKKAGAAKGMASHHTAWRILASLTMAAGMLAPVGVGEAAIVDKSGNTLTPEGKVYNINPEKVSDNFAYNRFKQFSLDAGYIANLRFGSAYILANLVNEKVSINGIVNAVRNNAIDGHLMFLSPNGIAVGSTGVINAGQFTGIVPAQADFDKLYNSTNPTVDITLKAIETLRDSAFAAGGVIDISGQINTHSGVMLGSGIINIKDGSTIQSVKSLNFTNLVNTGNTGAGLTLATVEGTGGDIILTAKQESDVKDTKPVLKSDGTPDKDKNGKEKTEANPIRWSGRSTDISAAINIGTDAKAKGVSITSSDGAVKLAAESKSTYEDSTPMTLTDTLKGVIFGDDSKILNGLVDKLAGKEAGANKYLFVNYSSKKNKAAVNIGENSALTGKNIDIAANSNVEIKQSITVPTGNGKKDSEGKTVPSGSKAVAAVAVSRVYNTADVVIDGNLTAKDADKDGNGIKIAANADTKADISATGNGGDANAVAVGVAVLTGDTKAKVNVNDPANAAALSAAKGKAAVEAVTTSDVNINVGAVGKTSYVVSNVGVANYDTSADVNINRSITAGAVDIKAENNITGWKMTVDNTVKKSSEGGKDTAGATDAQKQQDDADADAEKKKPDSEKSADEKESEKKSGDPTKLIKDASVDPNKDDKTKDAAGADGKGGVKDVKDKVEGTNEGGNNEAKTSAFGLGASVGVVSNKNDANVTLGKNVVITAAKPESAETPDGSVKVAANTLMTASADKEDSLQFSVKNAQANSAKVEIGAAVLVTNVKNNAKILLDNEGDKSAQITGGAVSLDAKAGQGSYKKDDKDKTSVLSYAVNSEGTPDKEKPATVVLDGSVGVNTLKNDAIVLLGQKSKVEGTAVTLSADAVTNAEGSYGAKEENSKVGVGATVGIQNISGNSLIMAGKEAALTGSTVSASASNSLEAKNEVKNAGKGDSLGVSGMVALSYGDSNNIISLDDEVRIKAPEGVSLTSTNSTSVDNSARSESEGKESSKAFGIGVGIINYDVNNIALVSDNGKGIIAPSGSTTDVEKAAQKIYQDTALAQSIAGETFTAKLGQQNTEKGSIITNSLIMSAITTGSMQNDAKAKVVSKTAEDKSEDANSRKESEKWTQWSKKGNEGASEAKKNTEDLEQDKVEAQNESAAPTISGKEQKNNNATKAAGEASQAANPDDTPKEEGAAPAAGSSASAGASIGIEGSAALTFLGGRTDALLNNVTVKNETAENAAAPVASVALSALDFLNSITMGGTDIRNSVKSGNSATKVGIGGTFAMNSSNRDVDAIMRNSELQQVGSVSNAASKIGIELAAGMGVSASKGDGTNVAGAGVVYYNKAKQDIHALMIGNTIAGTENSTISNKGTSTDFQIAGGLAANSASGAKTNVGVGGAVAISNLENNLSSGIIGGTYQNKFQSVDVTAQKGTTQINGALAATFAGGESGYGFEGAFAYGSVKNTTRAYISGVSGDGLKADAVNVKAGEIPVPNAADSQEKKDKDLLSEKGIDVTGKQYLDTTASAASSLDDNAANTDAGNAANEAASEEDEAKAELGQNKNLIITAAVAGGWNGKAGVGAGISYNYVKNDIAADIQGSTIKADTLNGEAASDAMIVSVGAGVAIGGKAFNGAGSGSWNDLKNDTKVTFADNIITGKNVSEQAQNTSSIINIAGEVAGGKGMAMGLSLAYNSLNNTTGTYLTGNDITLQGTDNSVKLATTNQSKALAVAGGVNVNASQEIAGAVGTVAINRGVNNTESVIDGKSTGENTKLDGVKNLSVTAEELTKKTTVAGSVSVGGKKVGIGGAVAYASVGSKDNKEKLRAEINHADITTTSDGKIDVSTKDSKTEGTTTEKSRLTTVGAGFGVSWGKNFFNLQGGAAVADIYKDSRASLNNTNINKGTAANYPSIDVTADTKSKINTVGVGGSVDIGTAVKGTAGVAINRMNQDTKAEMAADSGTTAVNAGLTQVRATGDGDIHSVGVGGMVGVNGQVAFAGSGSYNYIGNNVDAVIRNQNLTSNSSVGVVAQSDDRLYNFAGGFAIGANTKAGLGAAVSINKITGSTNALVQGGSLQAADSGSIQVTRPQDENLFTTEKLDLTTERQRLSENRKKETKSGIVVDSSATHTIISQLASGGVAASSSVGVELAGTVNLNTIEGDTTAKIKDANIGSAAKASNVNVNAVDYTNFGSFTGTPSVGAAATAGVSVGVSANWETMSRTTAAEISSTDDAEKKNVYAKNLTVDATTKHGSSALSFAGAVGAGATAGVASGDSIMRHKNTSTTSAALDKINAVFDGKAEILAEHLGNSRTMNIGASLAGGYAAVAAGAGVAVMDDTSTVKAVVNSSDLKAKSSVDGKDISVLAKNENNWKSTLVTASLAVGLGAGLAANVGINNTTSETSATVSNSQLKAAEVTINATDKLTADSTGGVGAGGIGGVGVSVALNNINSSVSANVVGGSVEAAKNVNVAAEEVRKFDSSVTGAAAGGIGVGVNVAVTSINKGITDAQLSNAADENGKKTDVNSTTQNEINVHLNGAQGVNNAKGALGVSGAKFFGLNAADKSDLEKAKNTNVSLSTPDTKKQGIHTSISGGASLTAAENVNVTAKETSDISAKNVTVGVGGMAVGVTDAIIHTNHDTDVTLDNAAITGKNVNIKTLQGQADKGSEIKVTAVSVGAGLGVGVGYAGIVNKGATDINITGSTIKGTENVTVNALDESRSKTQITNVGVAALEVTTTFANVENEDNVGVTLGGTNNISAAKNIAIDAKKANALEAHTQGVGAGGANVAVNHATIEDKGTAAAKITGTDGKFTADSFHLGAANDTTAKLSAGNTAVSVLGISTMRGKGVMDMGAETTVAGGSFNAKTVEFASMLGNAQGRTIEGNVKGHNISVGAVAPDTVRLETTATGKVNVANSTFGEDTNLILDNESYVDRKAYIYDVTVGGVAVGNSRAIISGNEKLTTTLTGKAGITNKLNSLQLLSYGDNTGKALADAGGGGLAGYVGAHVDNKSTNTVSSSIGGKWDTTGEVYLLAAQKDETRLTASEGHGGVIGVGGTSVENNIDTKLNATVEDSTEINADRVHVGTSSSTITGAYNDINANGVTDNQAYTLKDYFGGAIAGNRLRSLLEISETGSVTIGENAKITSNKLQEFIAASDSDLVNHAQAKGGAAVGVVDTVAENNITVNNSVDVKKGALLSNEAAASTEDIILAAYDEQKLNSHTEATVGGAAGVMVAKNNNELNRRSTVNVAGIIESGSKVGLYAGANTDGVLSNLKADLKAGAYNHTAIPVSTPRVNYNITADKGTVDVSGTVRSTGDINVIASGGKEEVVKDQSLFNWVLGGSSTEKKFLSSDAVVAEEALPKASTVNVTGSLIAGTADPINLTIGGSVASGLTITAPDNRANNRVKNGVKQGTFDYANTLGARWEELDKMIAAYDGADTNVLAAYIAERERIQNDMINLGLAEKDEQGNYKYTSNGRSVYFVEIPDIATSGGNINVTSNDLIGTGNLRANSAPGVTITNNSDAYLKLNNILMGEQGGKIVYNTNTIPPNTASGNAKINSINISSKSGAKFAEIYGVTGGAAAGLSVQNTFKGNKTSTLQLTEQMRKEIDSSNLTAAEKAQYKADIQAGKFQYTAITDVEVDGKLSNFYGNVTINNTSGDIRINGGTKERPTGVMGNTVSLIAAQGTIAQGYKEGIVNINGDPEKYLADKADEMKPVIDNYFQYGGENYPRSFFDEFNHGPRMNNEWANGTKTYTRPDSSQTATGYIAGRDVYVSAANVNVNGLIQSGYKNYTATVTQADLTVAQNQSANRAAIVQNRTMYKVNEGGAKWNAADKVFDYVAQVYWDPSTKQLFVEDIETGGGKVYLTGRIASTGDGRILAADGAANITVTNETALDMNVGKVLNSQREGVITIADTAKNTWTEYKKGQTRTINDYTNYMKKHAKDGNPYANATVSANNLSVSNALTYTPQANQTYHWAKGEEEGRTVIKQHHVRYGMWGLVKTKDMSEIKGDSSNITQISSQDGGKYGLPEGATIQQNSTNVPEVGKIRVDAAENLVKSETSGVQRWLEKTGFLGWFKNYYTRWTEKSTKVRTYDFSINASQNISIGLLGADVGKIDIKSTNANGGSINLTDNVANSHNQAVLTIDSKAGNITQFDNTTLKSEIVNLSAKDDIKNIHLASIGTAVKDANGNVTSVTDNIKLNAVSTDKGDIDITAMGGILENRSLPGNVQIVALKSQDGNAAFKNDAALGDVTLNAAGNITQSGSGITVEGRGIYLTSEEGGIGTKSQALNMAASDLIYSADRYGAQVNASAKNSIYLTEAADGGNMRVGKIESREGDVKLTVANGAFIDGLPDEDKSGSMDSVDEMVHRWIDAGLIDGEKDAQGNYTYKGAYITGLEKARDDYKANIEAAYDAQKGGKSAADWKTEYTEQKTSYQSYLDNKARYGRLSPSELQKLEENSDKDYLAYKQADKYYSQYGTYATADDYLKANSTAYKYAQYASAEAYLAVDDTYKGLKDKAANPTFEWTKDMMLYAVSEKLVNPEGGSSTQTNRAANVLGNNVTLSAAQGAVGTFANKSTEITVDELTGSARIAKMKELMNANASDVTVHRDDNGNLLSFEIKGNMPLGVKVSGTLDVTAGGNISVAGRKDAAGDHSAIAVGTIDATQNNAKGDVRLHSDMGIYNAKTADDTNIKGNNLILTGGKESIGASEKPLTVSLSGEMTEARADKNVFIKNMKADDYLRLGAMVAKDTISLNSDKGFLMSNANAELAASYINAGKTLTFNADATSGIVGAENAPIRILNDRAAVNITAKEAYLRGVGSLNLGIQNGTLVLGNINTAGTFMATSDGSLAVGREEEKDSNENVVKEAVTGAIQTGGDATLAAKDKLTLDGTVNTKNKTLTLKAVDGDITQTAKGIITAGVVKTFNGKSLLLENTDNAFGRIEVDGIETAAGEKPAIAGDVRIKDNASALTVGIKRNVAGDISVSNLRQNGTLVNAGDFTAAGKISLNAQGSLLQAANTTFTAGNDVELTSSAADIRQATDAGIKAAKVTAVSAKTVALQGTGNQFGVLAVQSVDADVPLQGSVLVQDSADKLELSVPSVVNGDIVVENTKGQGVIQVVSELQAKGDGADANGDITLKSDGSMKVDRNLTANRDVKLTSANGAMNIGGDVTAASNIALKSKGTLQTDAKLAAGNNIELTSTQSDVLLRGDIFTGSRMPVDIDLNTGKLNGTYDSLIIHAGGAVQEADGVTIATPVVETYSGKGVSMESVNNEFAVFFADALTGRKDINGSVKAVTNYAKDQKDNVFTVGVGANILGDAEFTNINGIGELGILIVEPEDANEKIEVLGGNGAEGDLVLRASQDVTVLGDANAKHDIVIESTDDGSFYGVGRGLKAGNDVKVSTGETVAYIGTIEAGHDISIQVQNAGSADDGDGIYIGTVPDEKSSSTENTSLKAGNQALFNVNGSGDILLYGNIGVANGTATVNISDKGNIYIGQDDKLNAKSITAKKDVSLRTNEGSIFVTKSIASTDESVTAKTGKGIIFIGTDKVKNEETITAQKNVTVETDLGTVFILGKTVTQNGDISMKAGKEVYEEDTANEQKGNFIIRDDGSLISGGGIKLNGRNGDIHITDDIQAKKGITVDIAERGNVSFDRDVSVTGDVDISTDHGNIAVGHGINSDTGAIRLQTDNGDIQVGKDITAGKDVTISSHQGDIIVGDIKLGNDGDVLAKSGNVSIKTDKGVIGIVKTVKAQNGSVDIETGEGSIGIGYNGADVPTVVAEQDITLTAKDGIINVDGKTQTIKGDISVYAHNEDPAAGDNIVLLQNGILDSGRDLTLHTYNGSIAVTDSTLAKRTIKIIVDNQGDIAFGRDINVVGDVSAQTANGSIAVAHKIKSSEGSIDILTKDGNILIGDNGPDVETVAAYKDVKLQAESGKIEVYGKTSTTTGDVTLLAGNDEYVAGEDGRNIIIDHNGAVSSGRDARVIVVNGDIHMSDKIAAKRNLDFETRERGDIMVDKQIVVANDMSMKTEIGSITVGEDIKAGRDVNMTTGTGSIQVGADNGKGNVLAGNDVNMTVASGSINVDKTVKAQGGNVNVLVNAGDIQIGNNGPDVDTVAAYKDVNLSTDSGEIRISGKTVTETGDIKVQAASDEYVAGLAGQNVIFDQNGKIAAARDATLSVTNGDLHVTDNVTAVRSLKAETRKEGNIALDTDVTVNKEMSMKTEKGSIDVGGTIMVKDGIAAMTTDTGNITVGKNVTAGTDVNMQTNTEGSIAIGADVKAGQDVNMTTNTGDVSIGADVNAGQNVNMTVNTGDVSVGADVNAGKDVKMTINTGNITIGDDVKAGSNVNMAVKSGNITVGLDGNGSVVAGNDLAMTVDSGDVSIAKAVKAISGNVDVLAKDGDIQIGNNGPNVETVAAYKDVNLNAESGKIQISGKTATATGDITVHAANDEYVAGAEGQSILFDQNGQIAAARDAAMIMTNGDLHVTDHVMAKRSLKAETRNQGNIALDTDVTVNQDMTMKTETGNIDIGRTITAKEGAVSMTTETGSITVGKDVTAARNVSMNVNTGDIAIGADVASGNDVNMATNTGSISVGAGVKAVNDVNMTVKLGNISVGHDGTGSVTADKNVAITVDKGDVSIEKAVKSKSESVNVLAKDGNIMIGDNMDADTVGAMKDVTLESQNGKIEIFGRTATETGNISVTAINAQYNGADSIIFDHNGKLDANKDANLIVENGDLHITDHVTAGNSFNAVTRKQGNITLDDDITVVKDMTMKAERGDITVGRTITAMDGSVSMGTDKGDISVGEDITVARNVELEVTEGDINIGGIDGKGNVEAGNDVKMAVGNGDVNVVKTVKSTGGNVDILTKNGDVHIGDNGADVETVKAYKDVNLETENGRIEIYGKTSTVNGDVTVHAGNTVPNSLGASGQNILFDHNGQIEAGNDGNLIVTNGSLHVTDHVKAGNNLNVETRGEGDISLDDNITVVNNMSMTTEIGNITVGKTINAGNDVKMFAKQGDVSVLKAVTSEGGSIDILTKQGAIQIGNNGPDVETVSAYKDVTLNTEQGKIEIYGKTSGRIGDVTLKAASADYVTGENSNNIIIGQYGQVFAGRDVMLETTNGDLSVTDAVQTTRNLNVRVLNEGNISMDDVEVQGDVNISIEGRGSVSGNNIIAGGTTRVALTNGDLFLNLAEGKAVLLLMENNTEASRVNNVLAEASGGTDPDVSLTGNFINIGTMSAKGGDATFQISAMGAGNQKLINGEFSVESLNSEHGTKMPYLWTNRGYLQVDEGNLAVQDMLAVDKIHLGNAKTDVAVYGRTPTRDGEQLVYWNNLGYSKERAFQLYTNGKLRTSRAVLIDAGRNYGKLYGDNLSVVDMMRERVTNLHGRFTFDSTLLTEPGKAMRGVFFDMAPVQADFQQKKATDEEIVVD
ncbi:leukotoxin LktA like protein [Selenomonas ruminantium]|uniref:Extended Signal Peptide of Type V secretion system n=1 Tax=Selenomonas ruminantium TaxID=971 RepID=A0A1H0N487_SELRU|nr:leukotoxin LktA like protein [Selenomonas ruminantium]SDO87442.1 hypothetical protein SAMN05216366_102169 [Selenomonas ruminantium]